MKTLLNPWFIVGCLAWLCIHIARIERHPFLYLNGYLTDFFAVPVLINISLWLQRVFIIKNDYYVLSPIQVIFFVIFTSVLFEGILPLLSKTYTADWKDIMLYIAGGFFFYFVMNKPVVETREKT